jgi:hypothetical protein
MSRVRAFLILCIVGVTLPARAEPLLTSLDEVVAQSTDVVIATTLGGGRLQIERALRGRLRGAVTTQFCGGTPDVPDGARIVAFLGAERRWCFVGEAIEGRPLTDALRLRGFYEFNAHIVTPSVMTIDQLRGRLAGRPIQWQLEGPLLALAPDGSQVVETRWRIRVTATEGGATVVSGLPALPNLPAPTLTMGGHDPTVALTWRTSWPRPLEMYGQVVGRSGDVLQVRFSVVQPDLFREADLARYFADGNAAYVLTRARIVWNDGSEWSFVVGDHYMSHATVRDARGREQPWDFDVRESRASGDLTMAPARPGVLLDTFGSTRVLLQELLRGPIELRSPTRRGRLELVGVELPPAIRVP